MANLLGYDQNYVRDFTILSSEEIESNIIKESVKDVKRKEKKPEEFDEDEENFLKEIPTNLTPQRRRAVVELIQRNSRIAKKLKRLYDGHCQICGFTFKKKDGENFAETHHLIPLGDNVSDAISNIIVVCPNCHSQLTYAEVELGMLKENKRMIKINNEQKEIRYNPKHFQAVKELDVEV